VRDAADGGGRRWRNAGAVGEGIATPTIQGGGIVQRGALLDEVPG